MSIQNQLKKHLGAVSQKWKKMITPIAGVFITRAPESKNRKARLYLEIIPLDEKGKQDGKSIYIFNIKRLNYLLKIFKNPDIRRMLKEIQMVNAPVVKEEESPVLKMPKEVDE